MRLPRRFGALGERQFRLLLAGQAVSAFGDGLFPVALAFAVLELTGSAADLGLVFMTVLIPRVALMLAGGVWADRLPRQLVMVASDGLRGSTQTVAAILLVTGTMQLWELVALAGLYGAGDAFFYPAVTGLVPETVASGRLQQANAMLGLTRSASWLAGPVVAGTLVATAGPGWAFAGDAATFAVSGWFLARIRLPRRPRSAGWTSFLAELRRGWHEVSGRTWVWSSIVFFSVWNLALGALFVLGPVVSERSLGGASSWGLIVTSAGVGSLAGTAVALQVRPRRPLATGFLAIGICALEPALLARPFPTWVVALSAALGFGATAFSNALWFTTLQERIPRDAISRVSAYDWLGSIVFQPLGYALVGPLAAALGTGSTLILAAVVLAVASITIALLPSVRAVRLSDTPA